MLVALTNLFGVHGGIPSFNRLLCRAAVEEAADRGMALRVVALGDARTQGTEGPLAARQKYIPCGGDRRRFIAEVLRGLFVLRQASPKTPPRLVLGHVNLAPLAALLGPLGPPFGVIAHGTEVWTPLPPLRRWAIKHARRIGCVSDHTAEQVAKVQGVAPARCQRLINALDPERFAAAIDGEPAAREAAKDGMVSLLSVTRLHPQEPKGIDLVLAALPALPQCRYTVAGEGDDLPRLRALAQRLGVADRVRFLGRVSDAVRAEELTRCDIFCLPSSGEGFGIVYLEAMIYGKPCVAAQVGGAKEVVLDGQTGRCVAPEVLPLTAALAELAADGALRAALGQAGRQRVLSHFCYPQFKAHAAAFFAAL